MDKDDKSHSHIPNWCIYELVSLLANNLELFEENYTESS